MEISPPSIPPSPPLLPISQQREQIYDTHSVSLRHESKIGMVRLGRSQGLSLLEYNISNPLETEDVSTAIFAQCLTMPNFSTPGVYSRHSAQLSPTALSAEYDPFASFRSELTPYPSNFTDARSTVTSLPPHSPSLSEAVSHRTSFSSAPASEPSPNTELFSSLHGQIKIEPHHEWLSETTEQPFITTVQSDRAVLAASASCYPGSLRDTYFQEHGDLSWPKVKTADTTSLLSALENVGASESGCWQSNPRRPSKSAARTRTLRRMTTREDANYQCQEKGCGKLFSRSYNFKAHMETHDADRIYPFHCPLPECSKKFVRRTDLQRHHQSVHIKERKHQCDFCTRMFARKDTLRRHMEDGCPKRFDLAFKIDQQNCAALNDEGKERCSLLVDAPYPVMPMNFNDAATQSAGNSHQVYSGRTGLKDSENDQGQLW